ncbi:hypothetical protein G6O67_004545 [Ophiocordyceps sinensis]|uniref:Uncharacterized protein n=1 Tax=Ophiocordyceps sinensis TaxID=72228 RepID=A0A8H4PPM4_9HYPO|nr:hypothetical protein G6O67_004545 [Ophiocordyceps sinensis]
MPKGNGSSDTCCWQPLTAFGVGACMHGCAAPPSWPLEEFDAPVAKAQPDEETVVTRAPISWPCRMLPAERPAGVLACVAGRHLDAADCAKLFGSNWDLAPMSDAQLTYILGNRQIQGLGHFDAPWSGAGEFEASGFAESQSRGEPELSA